MQLTKPILLGLHGLPGSGKDTLANTLLSESGAWSKVSFAAPLKRGLSTMLDIPMEDIENQSIKNEPNYKFGRSIRYMLQTLGTEWGRELITDQIWVELAKESIEHQFARGINVVNTDLRYPNEVKMIKSLGGYVIHITREDKSLTDKASQTGVVAHASNVTLDANLIDYTIQNNWSLEMFHDRVASLMCTIIEDHNKITGE